MHCLRLLSIIYIVIPLLLTNVLFTSFIFCIIYIVISFALPGQCWQGSAGRAPLQVYTAGATSIRPTTDAPTSCAAPLSPITAPPTSRTTAAPIESPLSYWHFVHKTRLHWLYMCSPSNSAHKTRLHWQYMCSPSNSALNTLLPRDILKREKHLQCTIDMGIICRVQRQCIMYPAAQDKSDRPSTEEWGSSNMHSTIGWSTVSEGIL